jgi:hypothetical protein
MTSAKTVDAPSDTPTTKATEKAVRAHPDRVNVAALRGPREVQVDNMTRRSDADALQGHFVSIDLSDAKAKKAVEAVVGEGNASFGNGDYGVFVGPGDVDEHGYPVTATVFLRDDNGVQVSGIPYSALTPADAGRR